MTILRKELPSEHAHQAQHTRHEPTTRDKVKLATSATAHCLSGCGIGEVVGVIVGTALAWSTVETIVLAVILGFVFGFALGLLPLLRARFSLKDAVRQVLLAEGLSIAGEQWRGPRHQPVQHQSGVCILR